MPPSAGSTLVRDVVLYTFARLGVVALIALVLVQFGVPVVVALLLALVVSLPLSLVLLRGLRGRVNEGIGAVTERRRVERERLRTQLRGEERDAG